jgi:hypothetical protein
MSSHQTATYSVEPQRHQQPLLTIELPPHDQPEQTRLRQVQALVQQHGACTDLTHLAAPVRQLLGEAYAVGSGAAHVWIMRTTDRERLAIIADQHTTSVKPYADAWEPVMRVPPSARQRRKKRVRRNR